MLNTYVNHPRPSQKLLTILFLVFCTGLLQAQDNSVAIGSTDVKQNAVLWLNGNGSQGLLLPTVTNTGNISNPDAGMIVYQTSDNKIYYRNESAWVEVGASSAGGDGAAYALQLSGSTIELLEDGNPTATAIDIQSISVSGDITGTIGATSLGDGVVGITQLGSMGLTGGDTGKILQWNGTTWETADNAGGGITYTAGTGIDISGSVITNTGDLDPTNEIQDIAFDSGTNTLTLTEPGQPDQTTDLSSLAGGGSLTAGSGIDITAGVVTNTGDTDALDDVTAIGGLTDVNTTGMADGKILKAQGGEWVIADDNSGGTPVVDNATIELQGGTTLQVRDAGITAAKMAPTSVSGGVGGVIQDGSIVTEDIANGEILNEDINPSADIDVSKLAGGTSGQVLTTNGGGTPVWQISGAAALPNTGNREILIGDGGSVNSVTTTGDVEIGNNGTTTITILATTGNNIVNAINTGTGIIDAARVNLPTGHVINTDIPNAAGHISGDYNSGLTIDANVVTTVEIGTSGFGDANKVLTTDINGDPQWELKSALGGDMLGSNNLSDVADLSTARTNLGLGALATQSTITTTDIIDITNVGSGAIITAAERGQIGTNQTNIAANTTNIAGSLDRTNHTGTQTAATISDFSAAADARITTASVTDLSDVTAVGSGAIITGAERTQIGTNATNIAANTAAITSSLDRTNHTGTQTAATISDFSGAADARITAASVTDLSDVTAVGSGAIITGAERTQIGTNSTNITANTTTIDGKQDDVVTTLGDMVVRDASNAIRLPVGTDGQVLEVVAGVPSWATPTTGATTLQEAYDGDSDIVLTDGTSPIRLTATSGTSDFEEFLSMGVSDASGGLFINNGMNTDAQFVPTFRANTTGLNPWFFARNSTDSPGRYFEFTGSENNGAANDFAAIVSISNNGGTRFNFSAAGQMIVFPTQPTAVSLRPHNTGVGNTSQLEFLELAANGNNVVGFKAPDALANDVIMTLPPDNSSGVLTNDGSGTLIWGAAGAAATLQSAYDAGTGEIALDGSQELSITSSSSNPLIVTDDANERIGIGTSTPLTTLHVAGGNINIDLNRSFEVGDERVLSRTAASVNVGSNLVTPLTFVVGSEVGRFDIAGNLGIGTISPNTNLEVSETGAVASRTTSTSGNAVAVELFRNGAANIDYRLLVDDADESLKIQYSGNDLGGTINALTFDSGIATFGGSVGIGAVPGVYTLNVSGESNYQDVMYMSGDAGTAGDLLVSDAGGGPPSWTSPSTLGIATDLEGAYNGGGDIEMTPGSGDIEIRTTTTSQTPLFIEEATGQVGIGLNNPQQVLHVYNTNDAVALFNNTATGTGINDGVMMGYIGGNTVIHNFENTDINLATNGTTRMTVEAAGNIGVGTTAPNYNLQVNSSATSATLQLTSTATGTTGTDGLILQQNASGTSILNRENTPLNLGTNGANRMTISNTGNVGIGTTTPNFALNTEGTTGAEILLSRNDPTTFNGNFLGKLGFGGNDGGEETDILNASAMIAVRASGTWSGTARGSDMVFHTKAPSDALGAASTERMRIESDGDVSISNLSAGIVTSDATGILSSGTLSSGDIPNLPASQITSGTFSTARIPDLSATKITSGTLPVSRGGTGRTSYTTGSVVVASGGTLSQDNSGLFFDIAGNELGIGTNNPTRKLHVLDNSASAYATYIQQGNLGGDGLQVYVNSVSSASNVLSAISNSGSFTVKADGDAYLSGGNLGVGTSAPVNNLDVEGRMAIGSSYSGTSTAPANGLIVQGDVGIGLISPDTELHVSHFNNFNSGGFTIQNSTATSYWKFYQSSSNDDLRMYFGSGASWTLKGQFNDADGAYTDTSDRRLKKEIEKFDDVLDGVMKLSPSKYYFKDNEDSKGNKSVGLIAQDVLPLFPELVYGSDEDFYTFNYGGLSVVAVKAIQEQQSIIEDQETRIAELERQIERVESKNISLKAEVMREVKALLSAEAKKE